MKEEILLHLNKKMLNMGLDSTIDSYNIDERYNIYVVSDYLIYRLFDMDEPNDKDFDLQEKYVQMMSNKFRTSGYDLDMISSMKDYFREIMMEP